MHEQLILGVRHAESLAPHLQQQPLPVNPFDPI
jgi:hypothetical protein